LELNNNRNFSWVGDLAAKRAELTPDRIAIIDNIEKQEYSFDDMNKRANQTARVLVNYGINKGDRVATLSKNRLDMIDLFFATAKIGAILVPLNIRLATPELKDLILQTTPSIIIYDPQLMAQMNDLRKVLNYASYIVMGKQKHNEDHSLRELMAEKEESNIQRPILSFDDPHLILFTGGTTGLPKGALLSHRLIFWNAMNTIVTWGLYPNDVEPLLFPLFHTGGWNVLLIPCYYQGSTTILMDDFDADETLRVIEHYQSTIVVGVPTMFIMMANSPKFDSSNFDSVRVFISGGAACPEEVMKKYWNRGKILKMGYGLTECGPNNFYLPESLVKEYPLSVGFPVIFNETKLVNLKTGVQVNEDEGEVGELLLRGPHVFSGYWNNPEATKETIEPDGWMHTGDLVKKDKNGLYYIVGRSKEMYISGGENIFPIEIEEVLYKHPSVDLAAVIGIPDDKWGEVGKAFVTLKSDQQLTAEEIKLFLQENLARFKVPKHIVIKDSLPLSGAGKILKRELK
jgi:fatty-acyl-CoA synthase